MKLNHFHFNGLQKLPLAKAVQSLLDYNPHVQGGVAREGIAVEQVRRDPGSIPGSFFGSLFKC